MNLPNAGQARVDREKITEYLLSEDHADGRSKAAFFQRFGFHPDLWAVLAEALQRHGQANPVIAVVESPYGTRYIVDGEMETPDRRNARVRTVWIVEQGTAAPRLVTAYPIG